MSSVLDRVKPAGPVMTDDCFAVSDQLPYFCLGRLPSVMCAMPALDISRVRVIRWSIRTSAFRLPHSAPIICACPSNHQKTCGMWYLVLRVLVSPQYRTLTRHSPLPMTVSLSPYSIVEVYLRTAKVDTTVSSLMLLLVSPTLPLGQFVPPVMLLRRIDRHPSRDSRES
jgi:hypothetical protein